MRELKRKIAIWLCPELYRDSNRLYALKQDILACRQWLGEFPEIRDSMQRLLDLDRAVYGDGKATASGISEFREQLRKRKEKP